MTLTVTCHCGATRIKVPRAPKSATACTCTYCAKTGALWGYYDPAEVSIVARAEGGLYSPTTPLHEHYFCAVCGCTTHGVSPDYVLADLESEEMPEARRLALNLRLLDDFDLAQVPVETIDGRNLW